MDESFWQQVERAKEMTPDERIREGFRLFEQGRDYITTRIRSHFPDASEEEVRDIRQLVLRRADEWGVI